MLPFLTLIARYPARAGVQSKKTSLSRSLYFGQDNHTRVVYLTIRLHGLS